MTAKLTDDKILQQIDAQRKKAAQHQEELSKAREGFYRSYRAMPYGNERKGWAQTVLPVVSNIVETLKPALVEIFTGDFFGLKSVNRQHEAAGAPLAVGMDGQVVPPMPGGPQKPRDVAQDLRDYIRHKLFCQMDGEQLMDDFIHYALTSHYGVLKVTHREDYRETREDYDALTPEQFAQISADPSVRLTKWAEDVDASGTVIGMTAVKAVRKAVKYRGPWVEVIPPRELYFVPGYASLETCPYVAHVVKRDLDYILRQERSGVYRKGSRDKVKDKLDGKTSTRETDGEMTALFTVEGLSAPEDRNLAGVEKPVLGQNEVLVEEIYTRMDIDGDGLLEPVILTVCEDVVLREPVENPYGGPPFELGSIMREPDKMISRPVPEQFDVWQRMMTDLTRSVQDSAMLSAARGWKTNDVKLRKALAEWSPGDVVLTTGLSTTAEIVDFGAPNGFILQALERTQYEIDKASGVNEAMQGLDKSAMNRTLGGMEIKLSQSQEKQRLLARRLSRTWKRVIRRVLDILRLYPPEDDVRVIGHDVVITEDDLRAEYLVEVDVGVGMVDRQRNAAVVGGLAQLLMSPAAMQLGITSPEAVVQALRIQHEYLDVDTSDILPDPERLSLQQQMMQMQQQIQAMQGQLQQAQQENAKLQQQAKGNSPEMKQMELQADLQKHREGLQVDMAKHRETLQANAVMKVMQPAPPAYYQGGM